MGEEMAFTSGGGLLSLRGTLAWLGVISLLFLLERRRLSILPFILQYLLLALLAPRGFRPVWQLRLGVQIAVSIIVATTAFRVQAKLAKAAKAGGVPDCLEEVRHLAPNARLLFRLLTLALNGLFAYSLWRAYPLYFAPAPLTVASYWLLGLGLCLVLLNDDPLGKGEGILVALSGFEGLYLLLEQSLLAITLLGVVDLLLALGVAFLAESWAEARARGEGL